jgi:hypothetical protein
MGSPFRFDGGTDLVLFVPAGPCGSRGRGGARLFVRRFGADGRLLACVIGCT